MILSPAQLAHLAVSMMKVMQVSIVIPTVLVWYRWRHFPAPVRLLSWYVYLSLAGSATSYLLLILLPSNYWSSILFNAGKVALFGAVYYHIITSHKMRPVVAAITLATLAGIICFISPNLVLLVAISRVLQCAVLAAFALIYLEQTLNRQTLAPVTRDPFWLLSVGQLAYSAGTVTAFSLDYLTKVHYDRSLKYILIASAGLVFNAFLSMAFIRARRKAAVLENSLSSSSPQFAGS